MTTTTLEKLENIQDTLSELLDNLPATDYNLNEIVENIQFITKSFLDSL